VKNAVMCLLVIAFALESPVHADISVAKMSPGAVSVALAAIDEAKRIAQAGGGSVLLAGSVLSTDDVPRGNVVSIIAYPDDIAKVTTGMILLLAKEHCEPIDQCLVARRVTGRDSAGEIQTESYGSAEPLLLDRIRARLLGTVLFTVDLETGAIRDLRPDAGARVLSLGEAVARAAAR
jgi:hypothetical protein